ncbi:MAG: TlpA disulfide reductase family protein [Thermoguttaceae bacterium]|nr:TlpA disulfide reductase family protein [Thermoguttaceae bacterium]
MRTANLLGLCFLMTLFLLTAMTGCLPVEVVDDPEPRPGETEAPDALPERDPRTVERKHETEPEEPPPPPTIPKVNLTESLRATCLVVVDDQVPDGELADLEGNARSIRSALGEKLTILLFWSSGSMHSVVQLEDLARDIAGPLAEKGGQIVAVNVGDSVEKVAEVTKEVKAEFLILLDSDKAYFGKLATERLPRTYLLDAEGKILWFDLEYSRSTRRDLEQAIDVVLAEESAPN